MTLKLQLGKTYVDRNGDRHTMQTVNGAGTFFNEHQRPYVPDGRYFYGEDGSALDLVAEHVEPMPAILPHADLIRAVLDGKVVQFWSRGQWWDGDTTAGVIKLMLDYPHGKYRLKSEPMVQWCVVWPNGNVSEGYPTKLQLNQAMADNEAAEYPKVLRLELDLESNTVNATLEAP